MTNAILPGMTHSETPHPAPTPGFGAASRVDEGKTASAKPGRGLLLDKFKTPVAVLLGALVSLAHGAVSITSPVDYATVTVMPSVMRDFRSTFATGKKWSLVNSSTLGSAQRIEWETACRASQTAVALSWSGTGSTMCTVKVYRAKDGAEVFSATSTTGKASFPDAEIGRNYRWTVTYNSTTAEGHFYVNRIAPRMMNSFGGIGNSRDLGGWTTDSGKVVRQGLVFRSEEWDFVDSATGLYRDGCEPKPYWADTVGVNLDIDLRAKEWVNSYYMPANDSRAALDKSPLDLDKNIRRFRTEDAGTSVGAFPEANGFNAGGEVGGDPTVYTADQFKRAIAYAVHQFGNRDNYPILFHCSQGTDRTGALAYLLSGLLGVSEDDRDLDFVFSYAWDADEYKLSMWDMDTIRDTVNKCSGATFKDKCVTYVKNCYAMTTSPKLSATDAENDIATFRSMMLEDPEEAATDPSGDEESFVYENYYWMCDGAGGTLSDGMSYWYKDPEGETKWPADQQNIVNNPNAAVYLWPTAAHPYAYPVARAFTIGKLVSRISYGGTVGLVPGEPTTYEPNPSPKGYFTNTGHGVTDRPLWTHQSGIASAERLRMYLEAGTGTGSVQIWTNARLNLSAFESVYENVYIDFPAGKCDGATVCFYGLNGSQGESTVAWIQGGQDGTAQNLIVSNALLTVQRADKTSGVAGALNLEFDLGAANETTSTMMTVNGGFKMNAGSTIRVNAGGKPAGTYRLLTVGSGKTLTIPTATVRGAKVVGCAPGLVGTVALSGNVLSFTIVKTTATVTLGDHPHLAAAWTSGDGSVTNAVDGTSFEVTNGTTNVKVIFTADDGWEIVGDAVVELWTVTEDITFGEGSGFLVPRVQYAPVPYVDIDEVRACDPWGTIAVGYTVDGTDADTKYKVAFEVTAGGRTASVTNDAVKLVNGAATNEIDTVALFGKEIGDKDATVKISLIEAVLAPPPAGQLWEGGPIWAENNFGTSEVAEHPEYGALYTLAEATNAVVSIGQGWRVPSKDDFDKLIDDSYCTKGWDDTKKCWTFTGKGEYSSNSISLAAAGHDSGSGRGEGGVLGYYLSSTVDEDPRFPDTFVRNLFFNDGASIFTTIDYLRYSMSVRAVRDDTEGRTIVDEKVVATAKAEFCLGPLVTVGDHPHMTAAWTSGDGSVTNAIEGAGFTVPKGTTNVRVIFTADKGWEIVGDAVVDLGTVTENIVFGEGSGFLVPRVLYAPVPYVDIDEVRACDPWGTIAVGYTVYGTDADTKYEVAFEVTAGGRTASVTNDAVKLADGAATNEIDTVALFGKEIVDKDATVKISLIEAVLAPPPAGQLWEGGPIWAENNFGTSEVAEHPEYGALYTLAEATNAVVSIGQGWRVPSKDDFDKLIDDSYCTKGWDDTKKCWTFTGKGEYSSNSIFLAAAGHDSGSGRNSGGVLGYYLSSTVDDDPRFPDTFVRNLFFNDGASIFMTIDYLRYSMSVRAVRDDTEGRTIVDEKVVATAKAEFCLEPLVTVGGHPHLTAAWTSGDGSVTNEVEGAGFTVPVGMTDVRVIFTAEPGWEIVGGNVVTIETVTENITFGPESGFLVPRVQYAPVPYVDADGVERTKSADEFEVVTADTRTLTSGWYVVIDDVTLTNSLPVEGAAHLILCDGATLAITNKSTVAAVSVGTNATLTIYGQPNNTGRLEVRNGNSAAGIGGDKSGTCGTIAIHGGTVKAEGGTFSAGIGGGMLGGGGTVTITGGRVAATGHNNAADIGNAYGATTPCAVSISGGIFARAVQDAWLAPGFAAVANTDEMTMAEYPWAIEDRRVGVSPNNPLGPYATAVEATNAMSMAVFAPDEEVAAELTTQARARYERWFGLDVAERGASRWYVEAMLTDAAKSNLAETATAATRQIPVAAIAALADDATTNVTVTGCEPGFYYTLHDGAVLTDVVPGMANCDELCGGYGEVGFPAVGKPSDAAGFFRVGVDVVRPERIVVFGIDGKLFSGEVDINAADGTAVSVWPTNVKPGLVYGLGRSKWPTGPFVVEEDGWVQADGNGTLPRAITAPKDDDAGRFFRIMVREDVPGEML